MANYIDKETLLQDKRVRAEIDRHLWIESEKSGCDIGFDQAKGDWLNRFSKAWMGYHMPDTMMKESKVRAKKAAAKAATKIITKKRRSAKSYLK